MLRWQKFFVIDIPVTAKKGN